MPRLIALICVMALLDSNGSLAGAVMRPSYNTGVGFFVSNAKIYDANGVEFYAKGLNRTHYDNGSSNYIPLTKANIERWVAPLFSNATTVANFVTELQTDNVGRAIVPLITMFTDPITGKPTTCSNDNGVLTDVVNTWVTYVKTMKPLERYDMINIANEWGPSNSTAWRDSYKIAIAALRAAGYFGTLVIDSGGCGQDFNDILTYGPEVLASDPQHNVIFSLHVYGNATSSLHSGNSVTNITNGKPAILTYLGANVFSNGEAVIVTGVAGMTQVNSTDGNNIYFRVANVNTGAHTFSLQDLRGNDVDSTNYGVFSINWSAKPAVGYLPADSATYETVRLAQLAAANSGVPVIIGEFGPGRNIGPSPTMVWPGDVIQAANTNGLGWLAWAWDDNNLAGCAADDNWFSMIYSPCGNQSNFARALTIFGKDVVLNPTYGLQATAVPATSFP